MLGTSYVPKNDKIIRGFPRLITQRLTLDVERHGELNLCSRNWRAMTFGMVHEKK